MADAVTVFGVRFADELTRWFLPPFVGGLLALALLPPLAVPLFALAAFVVYFFRDPPRDTPRAAVVAPADGRVTVLREDGDRVRLGVFMSPFDVHVTRVPATGRLTRVDHRPGGHWPAFSKASDRNERVEFTLTTPAGRLDGAMIAGTVARRASVRHPPDTDLDRGERLGVIAFGSRTDLVFPPEVAIDDLAVARGDTVRAGETTLLAE